MAKLHREDRKRLLEFIDIAGYTLSPEQRKLLDTDDVSVAEQVGYKSKEGGDKPVEGFSFLGGDQIWTLERTMSRDRWPWATESGKKPTQKELRQQFYQTTGLTNPADVDDSPDPLTGYKPSGGKLQGDDWSRFNDWMTSRGGFKGGEYAEFNRNQKRFADKMLSSGAPEMFGLRWKKESKEKLLAIPTPTPTVHPTFGDLTTRDPGVGAPPDAETTFDSGGGEALTLGDAGWKPRAEDEEVDDSPDPLTGYRPSGGPLQGEDWANFNAWMTSRGGFKGGEYADFNKNQKIFADKMLASGAPEMFGLRWKKEPKEKLMSLLTPAATTPPIPGTPPPPTAAGGLPEPTHMTDFDPSVTNLQDFLDKYPTGAGTPPPTPQPQPTVTPDAPATSQSPQVSPTVLPQPQPTVTPPPPPPPTPQPQPTVTPPPPPPPAGGVYGVPPWIPDTYGAPDPGGSGGYTPQRSPDLRPPGGPPYEGYAWDPNVPGRSRYEDPRKPFVHTPTGGGTTLQGEDAHSDREGPEGDEPGPNGIHGYVPDGDEGPDASGVSSPDVYPSQFSRGPKLTKPVGQPGHQMGGPGPGEVGGPAVGTPEMFRKAYEDYGTEHYGYQWDDPPPIGLGGTVQRGPKMLTDPPLPGAHPEDSGTNTLYQTVEDGWQEIGPKISQAFEDNDPEKASEHIRTYLQLALLPVQSMYMEKMGDLFDYGDWLAKLGEGRLKDPPKMPTVPEPVAAPPGTQLSQDEFLDLFRGRFKFGPSDLPSLGRSDPFDRLIQGGDVNHGSQFTTDKGEILHYDEGKNLWVPEIELGPAPVGPSKEVSVPGGSVNSLNMAEKSDLLMGITDPKGIDPESALSATIASPTVDIENIMKTIPGMTEGEARNVLKDPTYTTMKTALDSEIDFTFNQRELDLKSSFAARGIGDSSIAQDAYNRLVGEKARAKSTATVQALQAAGSERRADAELGLKASQMQVTQDIAVKTFGAEQVQRRFGLGAEQAKLVSSITKDHFDLALQHGRFDLEVAKVSIERDLASIGVSMDMAGALVDLADRAFKQSMSSASFTQEAGAQYFRDSQGNLALGENIYAQRFQTAKSPMDSLMTAIGGTNVASGAIPSVQAPKESFGSSFGKFIGNALSEILPAVFL